MPSHFGSYILSHSMKLMNDVIKQISGFYKNSVYYIDTDSLYKPRKNRSDLVDIGFVGKSLGSSEFDCGNLGIFYAWFAAPKVKYSLMTDDFGDLLA